MQRQRNSWIVSNEGGKGLDVAIEIIVPGRRKPPHVSLQWTSPTRLTVIGEA